VLIANCTKSKCWWMRTSPLTPLRRRGEHNRIEKDFDFKYRLIIRGDRDKSFASIQTGGSYGAEITYQLHLFKQSAPLELKFIG
jgi:hypothetical protein